jgi:hypothetical protein
MLPELFPSGDFLAHGFVTLQPVANIVNEN